ncbi:MAG: TIGR01212 family radical SAM protein [Candidatus Makaraimicrobium thalassicum]|nr:MAG: TIGR01212 family radical SAM protein [Candidatus Omnitrophota bacterium]
MYYYAFSRYLKQRFRTKVRRVSLNAGFSCPHRDGTPGRRGCIFCNELGFSRFAGKDISLREQIKSSITGARKRHAAEKFIAYFQNATNTNAEPEKLRSAYDTIKEFPEIVGLCISTRPDCVDEEKLDLIAGYTDYYEVWVEYGLQTVHDRTLETVNRGHTFSQSVSAIEKTAGKGIKVGVHVILGLPGESREDMVTTAEKISGLPVSGVKLHVLHVLKDTELERLYGRGEISLLSRDEYVKVACDFLENLRPDCVILRLVSDAKKEYLVAPGWINDKALVIRQIEAEFEARGTRQGMGLIVKR